MSTSPVAAPPRRPEARRPGAGLAWIGQAFLLLLMGLAAVILLRNLWSNPYLFAQIIISGLQLGFVYALIALGYTMVYGIVKLINFAHGDVFMVGSFVSFYAVSRFRLHEWPAALGLPRAWVVIIGACTVMLLSMVVCMAMAVTIERVAYKPLRDAPRIAALITAIGVSFFLEFFGALNFVFSPRFIPYQRPFDVVTWDVQDGIHLVQPGQRRTDGEGDRDDPVHVDAHQAGGGLVEGAGPHGLPDLRPVHQELEQELDQDRDPDDDQEDVGEGDAVVGR